MVREVFDCVRQNVPDQQKVIQAFRSTHISLYAMVLLLFASSDL